MSARKVQLRRDTAANWTSSNPTLLVGEFGYESDTKKLKLGDGTTVWTSLAYFTVEAALGTQTKSFVITNPTASADGPLWRVPYNITIVAVHVLCIGGTNVVGQLWEYDANGANGSSVDTSDITGTAGSNVNDDGALNNASIASGNYLGWKTTSVSGAVNQVIVTFDYTKD